MIVFLRLLGTVLVVVAVVTAVKSFDIDGLWPIVGLIALMSLYSLGANLTNLTRRELNRHTKGVSIRDL